MPPPLDCTDFDFSLGEEVAFGPCTPQLESSALAQMPPQRLPSPEPCWKDLADSYQKGLGGALEATSQVAGWPWCAASPGRWGCPNHPVPTCPSQLQETLMQRQEELSTLRESNVQLKELASQARQLAAVLDVSAAHPPSGLAAPRPSWSLGDSAVGGRGGGQGLRAALGEAGGIRTLAFPQGNAFTLRTAAGGYRFRWVPR
ncbi:multicilin [Morphnus guianensis]